MRPASPPAPSGPTPRPARRCTTRLFRMGDDIRATRPDALVVVAAEHFANFFMNNMPAFAIGMADPYEGPIEDEAWLGIKRARVPGNKALSRKLIEGVMQTVDVAYAEEWKFDHGIMVPLHFLTPRLRPADHSGQHQLPGPAADAAAARLGVRRGAARAADAVPERIALVGTGGISHWPATPDSREDQRGLGPGVSRALGGKRPRGAAVVHRCRHLSRRRPGRLRDPHLHRRRGGGEGRQGQDRVLRAGAGLRRQLHRGPDAGRGLALSTSVRRTGEAGRRRVQAGSRRGETMI